MDGSKPEVWFEREILPDLVEFVTGHVTVLGPGSATPDAPYAALPRARGMVASQHRYNGALMDLAPRLEVISRTGIGHEKVDVAAMVAGFNMTVAAGGHAAHFRSGVSVCGVSTQRSAPPNLVNTEVWDRCR